MPAFDPIRDAILNSPVSQTPPLPARIQLQLPVAATIPSPSPSDSSPSTVSPITRRATDLAVLLNSDPPDLSSVAQDTPLFTPTTPRGPATLSHLLHPVDQYDDHDQLSQAQPLRRRTSVDRSELRDSYFSWSPSARVPESPAGLALPGSLPTPITSHPGLAYSPILPPVSTSRPSTAASSISRPSTAMSTGPLQLPQPPRRSSNASISPSPAMPPPPQPLRAVTPPLSSNRDRATPSRQVHQTPPFSAQTLPQAPVAEPSLAPPISLAPRRIATPPAMSQPDRTAPIRRVQHTPHTFPLPTKPEPMPAPVPMAAPKPPPGPPSSSTLKRSRSDLAPTPSSSKLPYAPRRRTPAGSVLVPLSPAEVARYRTFRGSPGTAILRKRKRDNEDRRLDDEADDEGRDGVQKRRRTGDVGLVVEHYNTRPEVGVTQRQESPIIGLKSFNNWVKSVLISRFAGPVLAASPPDPNFRGGGGGGKGRVLDMGCGKGGDLTKWAKARIRELVGLDIAAVSIEQAQSRHATLRGTRFAAAFFPLDCYAHELTAVLPPALLTRPFDVVSLQFCMHYAFETEQKARTMLANVAHSLRRGGVFIGTIPNSAQLLDRLDSLPPNAEDLSWGNNVYTIRFEDRTQRPTFGHRYWFFLKDAVDDVPEYVVHWDNFVRMAAEYGLHPVYKKEFHEVFEEHHEHPEFGPLLVRMKVVDANEESQMDEDQWEAANIYIAFAFEKR